MSTDAAQDFNHLIGQTLDGRYAIESLLGYGGMGGVFKATHTGLHRPVAIKVLRSQGDASGEATKRFEREAYSASRLDHPNCARVHDFGTLESGDKYLVMELVEGFELQKLITAPWAPARAVELGVQILRGLAHAHAAGIVHRDLKPANVLVHDDESGRPVAKLVDFGIAKVLDGGVFDEKLTRTGVVFGTPSYMSPEQASGGKIDGRTDIYAAGLILYQVLAGHPPFQAESASELLRMHIIVPPPPLPESVPPALAHAVYRMLEKLPKDRFESAEAAAQALEQMQPTLQGLAAAAPGLAGSDATAAQSIATAASLGVGAAALPGSPESVATSAFTPAPGTALASASSGVSPAEEATAASLGAALGAGGVANFGATGATLSTSGLGASTGSGATPSMTSGSSTGAPTVSGPALGVQSGATMQPTTSTTSMVEAEPKRGRALPWIIAAFSGGVALTALLLSSKGEETSADASEADPSQSGAAAEAASAGEDADARALGGGGDAERAAAEASSPSESSRDAKKAQEKLERELEKVLELDTKKKPGKGKGKGKGKR